MTDKKQCINCKHWKYLYIADIFKYFSPYIGYCKIWEVKRPEYDSCDKWKLKKKMRKYYENP